ncbi:MAG: VanZ family protein [Flavobacteriales bacterium]|nr:VanZ family protein [Flavobacteriales bacterium]
MRYTIAIVWVVVIAILHAIPGSDFPEVSFSDFFQLDKLIHAFIFMLGVYLFAIALNEQQKSQFLRYIVISFIAYGLLLEVLQGLVFVERSADILDWLADTIGVFLGVWIFKKFPFPVSMNSAKKD